MSQNVDTPQFVQLLMMEPKTGRTKNIFFGIDIFLPFPSRRAIEEKQNISYISIELLLLRIRMKT